MPETPTTTAATVLEADQWTDYWTCDVPFERMSGLPVPNGRHFLIGRRCRAVNPIFYKTCRRCGLPQGWENRKRPSCSDVRPEATNG